MTPSPEPEAPYFPCGSSVSGPKARTVERSQSALNEKQVWRLRQWGQGEVKPRGLC